jgi:tetratricopeptide (TPR) repeat protein
VENSTEKYALIFEFNNDSPLFARVANKYLENENYEQAITILEKGIFNYPEYPTAYYLYSLALAHTGEKSRAMEMARKAAGLQGTTESLKYYTDKIEEISDSFTEETATADSLQEIESEPDAENEITAILDQEKEIAADEEIIETEVHAAEDTPVIEDDVNVHETVADEQEQEFITDDTFNENVIDKDENIIADEDNTEDLETVSDEKENELISEDITTGAASAEDQIKTDVEEEALSVEIDSEEDRIDTSDDLNQISPADDEEETGADTEVTAEEVLEEGNPELEDELDILAEKLNNAVMPKLSDDPDFPEHKPDNDTQFQGKSLVSETLAKIHFSQGNYNQALSIYETLIDIQPEKKQYYETMIAQIKDKI